MRLAGLAPDAELLIHLSNVYPTPLSESTGFAYVTLPMPGMGSAVVPHLIILLKRHLHPCYICKPCSVVAVQTPGDQGCDCGLDRGLTCA
jgi:hypothetical protein